MRRLFVFFLVGASFLGLHLNAQQPNISPNKRITKANFVVGKTYVVDTIIQDKTYYKEYVSSSTLLNRPELPTNVYKAVRVKHTPEYKTTDSTNTKALSDLKVASELDKKWLETLYSHTLFDTIYKAVSQLKYTNVEYKALSTDTLKARLKALDAKTPFHIVYNPELENVIKRYLKYRSKSYEKLIGLSHFYFPMFEQTFDAYNIPLEMKYLAIVESALQPKAQSHAGATGLWQFMYTTGKMYNLEVNSYIDERSDPVLATTAAAQFLSKLYKIYGDWDLALAAYNSGPGNVNKAIRRSGGYKNYWNIRQHLPKETAGYVPAFLATLYIFEYAEQHGIRPQKPSFQHIETDTVHVKQMLSLDHVAELTNTNIEALQFLNPQYKHDIIPKVKNKTYILRLPRSATGVFVANETKVYAFAKAEFEKREQPLPQFFKAESQTRYRVKSGDYLGKIARQFGVRVSQIKRWNGLRSNNLKIGQRLTVYPRKPITATKTQPKKKSINTTGKTTYVVKEGDSLWSIAQKFSGVSVENIKDWNDISGTKLNIGSTLIVSE